jgi:hypothetical protein
MRLSTGKNRTLEVIPSDAGFCLIEREAYLPIGYSKRRWSEERVSITRNELNKLVAFAKETA